jgi:hypothetical protein
VPSESLQFEQLGNRKWIWYHQTPGGSFWRSAKTYRTRAAAEHGAIEWLKRRANPTNRGR